MTDKFPNQPLDRDKANRMFSYMDSIDEVWNDLEFYGVAEGVVYVTMNGRGDITRVEITPAELYPENADRLSRLILEAIDSAKEELQYAERERIMLIPEDLRLGC